MPVPEIEVHDKTRKAEGSVYPCHNKPRVRLDLVVKDGFDDEGKLKTKTIPDFGSLECRYDKALHDTSCAGCCHRESGRLYAEKIAHESGLDNNLKKFMDNWKALVVNHMSGGAALPTVDDFRNAGIDIPEEIPGNFFVVPKAVGGMEEDSGGVKEMKVSFGDFLKNPGPVIAKTIVQSSPINDPGIVRSKTAPLVGGPLDGSLANSNKRT